MLEVPVYLFTGFMDSGKTSLIRQTLIENDFGEGAKTLLIACEDGEVEYDPAELKRANTTLVTIEKEEDYCEETLKTLAETHRPHQIFLEYNGTWEMARFLETKMPKGWVLAQSLATVDATTFDVYMTNMRTMMMEQLFAADVVIFNRCDDETPKARFRRMVKIQNRKAQIVYERADGTLDENEMDELPYDLNADVIEITDMDYGIWYLDASDHPKKYDKKKIRFLALVYQKKGTFVPGRFAMTCCADDITFLGFKCKYDKATEVPHKSWVMITAEIRVEFAKEYRGKGPVLYALDVTPAQEPEDGLVYFS